MSRASHMITRLAVVYSARYRRRRAELFHRTMRPQPGERVLDLGSGDGTYMAALLPGASDVYIADLDGEAVLSGARRFGFHPVILEDVPRLPFEDQSFDIVFCSSCIEHVTIPKSDVWSLRSDKDFRRLAERRQKQFADEIRRVGKRYFVQTPNKWFPLESHTWLPGVGYLPRRLLCPLIQASNRFWPKKTDPDWRLLGKGDMARLFPAADILLEKSFGLTKSLTAVGVGPGPADDRSASDASARGQAGESSNHRDGL